MRVVLDTNVLGTALITKRKPAKLVHNLLGKRIELVISKPILSEFIDVIARPKFRQYADERTVEDFLKLLLGVSAVTDVKSKFNVTPDRGDNTVLATAYDAKADYIVSGDKHLLK